MRWQCNSCKGTYSDIGEDGVLYFHRCPPLSDAEIRAEGKDPRDVTFSDRRRSAERDENVRWNEEEGETVIIKPGRGRRHVPNTPAPGGPRG